ncbi:hypothetical protein MPER_07869 [Moniliophthora perniciosa FA553]|nr:hypothetical protein MPER_07869 [Moniliophthora perniciosa FA553]
MTVASTELDSHHHRFRLGPKGQTARLAVVSVEAAQVNRRETVPTISPNSSSPITPYGSSESSLALRPSRSQVFDGVNGRSQPVKVKVHFHEDIFVIQVPKSTEYDDLVEKVGRKIRLCGPRRDDGPLRVKYKDEDGDMVSLGSTEDVQMAFEAYRPGGQVVLYVT